MSDKKQPKVHRRVIVLLIVLTAVLLFPWNTSAMRDGGTIEFESLFGIYDITKWHAATGGGEFIDGTHYTDYEDKAKVFAANGYAAVVFSFYGNTEGNAMTDGATMLSQVKDLYAVMDSLGSLPGLNKDKVYLWGHSFGGRVAAYVANRRITEIKGLLLAEPTINTDEHVVMQDSPEISVNIFNMLKKIEVHTVIYIGTHDGFGENPGAFDKVLNTIPSGRLVTIDGSDHFFNGAYGQKMVEDACKQMNSWNS